MTWVVWASRALAAPQVAALPEDTLGRCAAEADAIAGLTAHPALPASLPASDRVAVVVGVPCHRSEGVPALAYSSRDADRVAETLEGAGYSVVRLLTVVDREDLDRALSLADAAVRPGGSLVVYFSGHGVLREVDGELRRYLVLSDTRLEDVEHTGAPVMDLDRRLAGSAAADRVVIQDTCFAARAGGKSLGLPHDPGARTKGLAAPEPGHGLAPGDLRLYASRFFEQATESPEHQGSVYTHHLLDALTRPADADLDGDRCVGLLEAHDWARHRTEIERQGFQVPQLREVEAHNLPLGCAPSEPTRAVVGSLGDPRWVVRLTGPDGTAEVERSVAPGAYRLQIRPAEGSADGPLLNTRVRLAAGEWLDPERELARRSPVGTLELTGGASGAAALPGLQVGLGGTWSPRDRGIGRPVLGLRGAFAPGPGRYPDPRVGLRSTEAELALGWAWTHAASGATLGPVVAAGAVWREVLDRDATPAVVSSAALGWLADPALRLTIGRRGIGASLESGARLVGVDRSGVPGVRATPMVRVGVGWRL